MRAAVVADSRRRTYALFGPSRGGKLDALPSPLWGGAGGGGRAVLSQVAPSLSSRRTTPSPPVPHKGGGSAPSVGREHTECAATASRRNLTSAPRGRSWRPRS